MKVILRILFLFVISSILYANESKAHIIAEELHLSAGSKAIIQWERIFSSIKKMKRYKIDKLNQKERKILKKYLIKHAIDSDQPTVAGV